MHNVNFMPKYVIWIYNYLKFLTNLLKFLNIRNSIIKILKIIKQKILDHFDEINCDFLKKTWIRLTSIFAEYMQIQDNAIVRYIFIYLIYISFFKVYNFFQIIRIHLNVNWLLWILQNFTFTILTLFSTRKVNRFSILHNLINFSLFI